jgi:O-antigen/teichoic acid export membrane protein
MCLSILPFTVLNLQAESLKGLKRIRDSQLIQGIGVPFVGLLLIWPLASIAGIEGVAWAYFAATALVAILGMWAWRNAVASSTEAVAPYPFAELWASCKPLYVTSLMNRAVLPWAPLFLLGIWANSAEVGVFGAATRVALLISFLLVTLNTIVAPKFAEFHATGDMDAMGKMARRSAALLTVLVSPLFLFMFVFSDWVMRLFGAEFSAGGNILSILMVGQLVNVVCGSVGYLLMMSGNEKTYRNITISSALLQLLLVLILAPLMGGIGAAIAASTAMIAMNLASVLAVYKRLGIVTIPGLRG